MNPIIEIPFDEPYTVRVTGLYAGQPFSGTIYKRSGFGYHVAVDRDCDVRDPQMKWRLAQIVVPPFKGCGYDISVVK